MYTLDAFDVVTTFPLSKVIFLFDTIPYALWSVNEFVIVPVLSSLLSFITNSPLFVIFWDILSVFPNNSIVIFLSAGISMSVDISVDAVTSIVPSSSIDSIALEKLLYPFSPTLKKFFFVPK